MEVVLEKIGEQKLGLKINGGGGEPIIITEVTNGAATGSELEPDDEITACNGKSFALLQKREALNILKNAGATVRLLIKKKDVPSRRPKRRNTTGNGIDAKKTKIVEQVAFEADDQADQLGMVKAELAEAKNEINRLKGILKDIMSKASNGIDNDNVTDVIFG